MLIKSENVGELEVQCSVYKRLVAGRSAGNDSLLPADTLLRNRYAAEVKRHDLRDIHGIYFDAPGHTDGLWIEGEDINPVQMLTIDRLIADIEKPMAKLVDYIRKINTGQPPWNS